MKRKCNQYCRWIQSEIGNDEIDRSEEYIKNNGHDGNLSQRRTASCINIRKNLREQHGIDDVPDNQSKESDHSKKEW